jgi:hypothetical protein
MRRVGGSPGSALAFVEGTKRICARFSSRALDVAKDRVHVLIESGRVGVADVANIVYDGVIHGLVSMSSESALPFPRAPLPEEITGLVARATALTTERPS